MDERAIADAMCSVQLVSLRARLKRAEGYVLNTDLQLECELLRAQIEAVAEYRYSLYMQLDDNQRLK